MSPAVSLEVNRPADALLRLLGADPATFRPLYRAQKLLLARGTRIVRSRRGLASKASPFTLLCLFATIYGFAFLGFMAGARSPLLGAAVVLTLGGFFLLLIVVTDHFDVLVNPREILVLAAHPHDGRSFLLAKVAAIGRILSLLVLLLFVPSAVMVGAQARSWAAAFAFLAGAAAASASTCLVGLLLAAALLRLWGRSAIERLMPWLQGAFQIGYLFVVGGPRLFTMIGKSSGDLGLLPWLLPSFWFLAPLELLSRGFGPAPLARLGLALATLALLFLGATRWLGATLSERLLEPPARRRLPKRRAPRGTPAGASERSRLFSVLRVHLRSDWRTRSEFLLIPLMGAFFILFYFRSAAAPIAFHAMPTFFYCWMLVLSADVLTRSSRPETLWWILAAPIDRGRFSLATVSLVRAFQLAPLFAALVIVEIRAGGSWPYRLALLLELLALGDLLVVMGKALFPDFPFSRVRSEGGLGGTRAGLTLLGSLVSSVATALVFVFERFGTPGVLAGAAAFLLLRIPASIEARRRAAAAAEGLELTAATG